VNIKMNDEEKMNDEDVNRTPAMAPILAPLFGVFFLGGHISLKNRS
jgi:hypothetical protein